MTQAVLILWMILLVVVILLLPYIVFLLHSTWKACRNIEIYFKEMLDAGLGVASNTQYIEALNDTISVVSGILDSAGEINQHSETIKITLADKTIKTN